MASHQFLGQRPQTGGRSPRVALGEECGHHRHAVHAAALQGREIVGVDPADGYHRDGYGVADRAQPGKRQAPASALVVVENTAPAPM